MPSIFGAQFDLKLILILLLNLIIIIIIIITRPKPAYGRQGLAGS